MKHGTRSGYNKHNCRCVACRDWERDRKARYRARKRGEEPEAQKSTLVNGVLPPDDPETRAAYEMTHAAQNGTASPEVQARWDENMANRVAHPDEFGLTRHGTLTGYTQGCRGDDCPETPSCSEVKREYQRRYRNRGRPDSTPGLAQNTSTPGLARRGGFTDADITQGSVPGHGTVTGYKKGCRKNCPNATYTCSQARRDYMRTYHARRFPDGMDPTRHGTTGGYTRGCRDNCPNEYTCRDAMRDYQREYKRRRRGQTADAGALSRAEAFAPFPWEIETN